MLKKLFQIFSKRLLSNKIETFSFVMLISLLDLNPCLCIQLFFFFTYILINQKCVHGRKMNGFSHYFDICIVILLK